MKSKRAERGREGERGEEEAAEKKRSGNRKSDFGQISV